MRHHVFDRAAGGSYFCAQRVNGHMVRQWDAADSDVEKRRRTVIQHRVAPGSMGAHYGR